MLKASTAAGRAYEQLRTEIVTNVLAPGTPLGEVDQSERLGVSRTPIREALRQLAADGLVERTGRMFVVTSLDHEDLERLFELRMALDSTSAALAARRGDPTVFADLARRFGALHEQLSAPHGAPEAVDETYRLVAELDTALDAAARNAYLADAQEGVRVHAARFRRLASSDQRRLAAAALEHQLVAEAVAAGDADLARDAMHVHLHRSLTHFRAVLGTDPTRSNQ